MTIIITSKSKASFLMGKDTYLLETLGDEPILHLYEWQGDAATYGYFTKIENFLSAEALCNLDLARRPTGGGIVFHICDLAFSVLLPTHMISMNTLENYAMVNQLVIETVQDLSYTPHLLQEEPTPRDFASRYFCMAKPTKYDVMVGGRKIGGAAQRRTKRGLLHQGTIALALLPKETLAKLLLEGTEVLFAMQQNSASILGSAWTEVELEHLRQKTRLLLEKHYLSFVSKSRIKAKRSSSEGLEAKNSSLLGSLQR